MAPTTSTSTSAEALPTDNTTTYTSTDPTTNPHQKASSKLIGDVKGAASGVAGSLQAATGTVLRNDAMAEKGFEKMSQEDQRLAAKSGKPPVGTEQRSTVESVGGGAGAGAGVGMGGQEGRSGREANIGAMMATGTGMESEKS
jgi:hypothetical protein